MNWFGWFLVAWWAASALFVVGNIGKPSKPTRPSVAVAVVIIDAALIVALLTVGTN
jgi:hypothetical protein